MVGRVLQIGDLEEAGSLGKEVGVQKHDFPLIGPTRATGEDGMLGAGLIARIIVPGSVPRRRRGIVLFDAAAHLGDQGRLQRFGFLQHRGAIGVFGFQMLAHLGPQDAGVAQQFLPALILHPRIVIHPHAAQLFEAQGMAGRDGGRRQIGHGRPGEKRRKAGAPLL